jgi:hypothetical protein
MAGSLLQTTACNMSAQVGGSENQIKASVGDTQALAQAKEEARLANERAKLEEDKRKFAEDQKHALEEQIQAQNAKAASSVGADESDRNDQTRYSPEPSRTRRVTPRHSCQSQSYYQPSYQSPPYVRPAPVTSSGSYYSPQSSQSPVVQTSSPQRSEPVAEYNSAPPRVNGSYSNGPVDRQSQADDEGKQKKKGFWKKALPWILGGAAAAGAGVAISRRGRH